MIKLGKAEALSYLEKGNEMLQENDEFYYDKVLDDEYYEMQVI